MPAPGEVRVGDLVVCASRELRASLGLELDVGMYLVDRKRDGLVWFAGPDRSAWLAKTAVKPVAPDDPRVVAPPEWLVRVHRAVRLLDGDEVELERDGAETVARIGCGGLDRERLRELDELLGPGVPVAVRPGGMARLRIEFPAR